MVNLNRLLPVAILLLLIGATVIIYRLGEGDSRPKPNDTEQPASSTNDQDQIDKIKQDNADEVDPDQASGDEPEPQLVITRSQVANNRLSIGAILVANPTSQTCVFKVRDSVGLTAEASGPVANANGTLGCVGSIDVSEFSEGGDWGVEVQAQDASGQTIATGVKIIESNSR